MNSTDLKIFLSSTFVDLKEVREKILKFLGVLKSDIINMEVFGSDETRPKEYCLQNVSECNFFIGVYAARYGQVDQETGFSLTELEYYLAYDKFKRIILRDYYST